MDPQAVWTMLIEALKELKAYPKNEHAREMAIRSLANLGRWLKRGGFPPTVTGEADANVPGPRPSTD